MRAIVAIVLVVTGFGLYLLGEPFFLAKPTGGSGSRFQPAKLRAQAAELEQKAKEAEQKLADVLAATSLSEQNLQARLQRLTADNISSAAALRRAERHLARVRTRFKDLLSLITRMTDDVGASGLSLSRH